MLPRLEAATVCMLHVSKHASLVHMCNAGGMYGIEFNGYGEPFSRKTDAGPLCPSAHHILGQRLFCSHLRYSLLVVTCLSCLPVLRLHENGLYWLTYLYPSDFMEPVYAWSRAILVAQL